MRKEGLENISLRGRNESKRKVSACQVCVNRIEKREGEYRKYSWKQHKIEEVAESHEQVT